MKKDSKTPRKSDRLPKYWASERKLLNRLLLKSEEYKESIEKGLPFFTLEELVDLARKYQGGITWNELDTELSKKGIIFKKATFRKYIQERTIPKSTEYRKTDKGREAIYPGNTIEHINFVQYFYRVADNELIDKLLEYFSQMTINAKDAIEEQLGGQNLREGVFTYLRDLSSTDDAIERAIKTVLQNDPDFLKKAMSGLEKIYNAFHDKFKEWVQMLEDYEIAISDKE
jgi:hypothetical protein